eukprot:1430261-Rhodomonas_salina.3
MWSFPKPEDIRAGILRTFSRSYSGQPRVSVEAAVPALKSVDEIAAGDSTMRKQRRSLHKPDGKDGDLCLISNMIAAYGEEAKTSSLLAQLKKIAPPVLGAASAAAIGVLAKAKDDDDGEADDDDDGDDDAMML